MSVTIKNTTKYRPNIPFLRVKEDILGKQYDLSVAIVGEQRARSINQATRSKDYVPNVLSFPLDKTNGEIYLTPAVMKREAKKFNHSERVHFIFLYIHGLLHLKGYDHGHHMDSLEAKYLEKYR